jgi:hypothetical protein
MSGEKSFLARWSRRKREAASDRRDHAKPANTGNSAAVPDTAVPPAPPIEAPPLVDPISLPPIESIGPGSDLRAFLAAGVPADLTRAALRRAWSAEPAIRDFIGLSESSWDFNAAGGVPGFGAMTAEEGRRLLAQAMGEPKAADQASPAGSTTLTGQATPPAGKSCPATEGAAQEQLPEGQRGSVNPIDPMPSDESNNIATQHKTQERERSPALPRRHHGGALPE